MKVQLVYFEGCPNAAAARDAIRRCLRVAGLSLELEEVDTGSPEAPEPLREWGSPTILVDGNDVAGELAPTGSSCRLYDNPDNRGVPRDATIMAALGGARASAAPRAPAVSPPGALPPDPSKLERIVESRTSGAARATMAGAVIAAVAASACCVVPAILALVGISGVGAAAALEPYRPILLGATAALLGIGFYLVYRKPRLAVDTDACGCPAPRVRRTGQAMLWLGAVIVVLFASYPYVAGARAQTETRGTAVPTASSQQATLHIDGMTCESCVSHIVDTLSTTPGVVRASVSFERQRATIVYDPQQVDPETLARTVSALDGYTANVMTP